MNSTLLRRFDRPAGNTRAGVARRIGLQVVFLFMDYDRFPNDRIRTGQTQFPHPTKMRLAGGIGLNVSQIALVTFGGRWPAVLVLRGIEMRAGRRGIGR